jgi:uroporphyrinogen III methyltransferase/synthase
MVYLVGAGPGDPNLITVKGLNLIKQCDTIIYDRLGTYQLLDYVKPDCKKIYVGKKAGSHYRSQPEINEILCEEGAKDKLVVRLKGGDPFVFGRGGEEAIALKKAGISYELVPGITSAIGVPEVCGIPVTHRGYSRDFHVYTAHRQKGKADEHSLEHVKAQEGTMIFLMGLSSLEQIVCHLKNQGMSENTPVSVISKGTMPGQKLVRGSLANICQKVKENPLESPAVIVVGENAGLNLNPDLTGPLYGKHYGLVGTPKLRDKMSRHITELGGNAHGIVDMAVVELPGKEELRKKLEHLDNYTYLAFTSQNTISLFFGWLRKWHVDYRSLAHLKLAAVGAGTRDALIKEGFTPDYVPENYTTGDLARGLAELMGEGDRLLLPRAKQGSEEMLAILDSAGVVYDAVAVYDVVGTKLEPFDHIGDMDGILFVSASGVKSFFDIAREERVSPDTFGRLKVAALGDVTAAALRKENIIADIVPVTCDIEHLVEALAKS